jgi:peptide/nickel transport system permease protein
MGDVSTKKSVLSKLVPVLTSLARRGLAGTFIVVGLTIVVAIITMTLLSSWISPHNPSTINVGVPLSPPSMQFPFGTNMLGQDMLSRVISGGSIMIQVAILSVVVCMFGGIPLGLLSSYAGGVLDRVLCLIMDSIYAFPGLVLAIAIALMLGRGVVNMALSIAVVYVPSYFRVIRSQVLSIKEMAYVEAAKAIGARGRTILSRYILPNVVPSIVVVATVNFADAILTAAGLTFIGLGVPVNIPDWGYDLTVGRGLLTTGVWWVIAFPGLMVVLLALGFTLMGEGLSELWNPRLEQ